MENQNGYILQGFNLKKSYVKNGREIPVFDKIDAGFPQGKISVITGRSGAGKSTLLNLLGGLDEPTSGSVHFDGIELGTLSNAQLADLRGKYIGIIFQNFNLLSSWTAYENVEAALFHADISDKERREKVCSLLTSLGLGDRLDNFPAELSVGQQQRVAVARTLVHEPKLILADEPTGDVDPETAKDIIYRLVEVVKSKGTTLVVATHGTFPLDIADKVYSIKNGALTSQ